MPKINEDELYQDYLTKVYHDTSGYLTYSTQEKEFFSKTHVCTTYGELLYPGVKKLLQNITIGPDDIFLDLGSGLGKCAMQVFMQTDLRKVIGIEASKALYDQVVLVEKRIKADFPIFWEKQRQLIYLCDNFIQADWQGATIVYTCSTSFTQELLVSIANKVNEQKQVKQVLSLRSIPNLRLPLKKTFEVECSWDTSSVYYYSE